MLFNKVLNKDLSLHFFQSLGVKMNLDEYFYIGHIKLFKENVLYKFA